MVTCLRLIHVSDLVKLVTKGNTYKESYKEPQELHQDESKG